MPDKITETTRVPMTLREHFFDDPFFSSSWNDMDNFRKQFFEESSRISERFGEDFHSSDSKTQNSKSSAVNSFDDSIFSKNWLSPQRWMIPRDSEGFFNSEKDSNLISLVDGEGKMEISLNTSGYKPEELKVQVADDSVKIEGKHEEKSQAGSVMVSKQFSKTYSLPQGAKKEEIVSNLSQDGVMVITVPKEEKIKEIKDEQPIKVEHNKSSEKKSTKNEAVRKLSDAIGRQDDFNKTEELVPFTMRDSFFDDPFFKNTRGEILSSRNDFFKTARESFDKSMANMESNMKDFTREDSNGLGVMKDTGAIKVVEDDGKLSISVDTSGYKPDELRVTAGEGMISLEGKHEEKSEAGKVMVSRQFCKSYRLPQGSRSEEVVSNLSKDGVLVVEVPKVRATAMEDTRKVPIKQQ